jgi:glutamate synthase domain-containing protein 2
LPDTFYSAVDFQHFGHELWRAFQGRGQGRDIDEHRRGSLSPHRLAGGCDVVFQIGTAKYCVHDAQGNLSDDKLREVAAIPQVKMFEIKIAQGAKPGKGGSLPAAKVGEEVARIRGILISQASILPNRHTDISNNEELIGAINHIRDVTEKPVGFKTVMGDFDVLADFFDRVLKRGVEYAPDFITIDRGDGGTGAAPMPLMELVGPPLRESLPRVPDILHERSLRERVRLIASGKMVNPSDVAWCLALGADFILSARGSCSRSDVSTRSNATRIPARQGSRNMTGDSRRDWCPRSRRTRLRTLRWASSTRSRPSPIRWVSASRA